MEKQEHSKFWLSVFFAVPILFVITGAIALSTNFHNGTAGSDNPSNQEATEYAKTFDFRADLEVDGSLLTVKVSANTPIGQENLNLELQHKNRQELSYSLRLINAGNNIFRGVLPPEIEYGEWLINLYPDNRTPLWRIRDTSAFPNNIVSIAARG